MARAGDGDCAHGGGNEIGLGEMVMKCGRFGDVRVGKCTLLVRWDNAG